MVVCEICEEFIASAPTEFIAGTGIGILIGLGIIIALVFVAAFYIYHSLAWMTIAKKLKYKYPWLAWIPFAQTAMVLEMGGFPWALVFLYLVPVLGWIALMVLGIISTWRIFLKRKYPGWLSLAPIIPKVGGILYLVVIGIVAWGKK